MKNTITHLPDINQTHTLDLLNDAEGSPSQTLLELLGDNQELHDALITHLTTIATIRPKVTSDANGMPNIAEFYKPNMVRTADALTAASEIAAALVDWVNIWVPDDTPTANLADCESLVRDMLDPDMFGHVVAKSPDMRKRAQEALGII